jgi:hypothetical protein
MDIVLIWHCLQHLRLVDQCLNIDCVAFFHPSWQHLTTIQMTTPHATWRDDISILELQMARWMIKKNMTTYNYNIRWEQWMTIPIRWKKERRHQMTMTDEKSDETSCDHTMTIAWCSISLWFHLKCHLQLASEVTIWSCHTGLSLSGLASGVVIEGDFCHLVLPSELLYCFINRQLCTTCCIVEGLTELFAVRFWKCSLLRFIGTVQY